MAGPVKKQKLEFNLSLPLDHKENLRIGRRKGYRFDEEFGEFRHRKTDQPIYPDHPPEQCLK